MVYELLTPTALRADVWGCIEQPGTLRGFGMVRAGRATPGFQAVRARPNKVHAQSDGRPPAILNDDTIERAQVGWIFSLTVTAFVLLIIDKLQAEVLDLEFLLDDIITY